VTFVPLPVTQVKSCAPSTSTLFPITSGTLSFTPGIASATPSPATTLTIRDNVPLGRTGTRQADVLATAGGKTVYTLSGETTRHPKCTRADGCLRIWRAVTVSGTADPTKPSNVTGRLGVWHRDGFRQVTLGGHPLYTFVGDTAAGLASGASLHSFGGTWNVVRTPAALTPSPVSTTPTPSPGKPIY
jgi:predicted lipoprotein with Yx(FWY)xxD motif